MSTVAKRECSLQGAFGLEGIFGFLGGMLSLAGLLKFNDEFVKGSIDRKKAEADAEKAEAIAANPKNVRPP